MRDYDVVEMMNESTLAATATVPTTISGTECDAIIADLDNATDGLGALKALIDLVQVDTTAIIADLDNGTDGLGALKILIDANQTDLDAIIVDTTAIIADLDNSTDGLSALKALIDLVQTDTTAIIADLDNATDGLGALKALIDLTSKAAVVGGLTDVAAETEDTATLVALARYNIAEAKEIERHLHNWERWFAIAQTNLSATRFAECLSVLALAADDPWTRLTPGAVNVWGSDVQIWGSDDAATILPTGHQLVLDFHRLRLHDANDDKKTYIMQIVSSPTSAADGRTAGTFTEFPLFIEKGSKSPAPIEIMYDRVDGTHGIWVRIMTTDGTDASTLDVQFGVHGYPA